MEFQKIVDHSGIVASDPIGALAHLQLGRAYDLQGDTVKARTAYQAFLARWKEADPDVPILKEAKTEFQKLANRRLQPLGHFSRKAHSSLARWETAQRSDRYISDQNDEG